MNALAHLPRTARYAVEKFEAFRISEAGSTLALGYADAADLDEAVNFTVANNFFAHKEHLLIRKSVNGKITLHLFSIKRKSVPRYVHQDHVTRAVHDLYAAPICSIDERILQSTREREAGNRLPANQ